jgi:hypothetical protein
VRKKKVKMDIYEDFEHSGTDIMDEFDREFINIEEISEEKFYEAYE